MPTKKSPRQSKRTPKHHRGYLAELHCSTKDSTRTAVRRWLKVTADDPAGLLAAARDLAPEWQPYTVTLSSFDRARKRAVTISFGRDEEGFWSVEVKLDAIAVSLMAAHLWAHAKVDSALMMAKHPSIAADDDGGEELSVPTISQSVAARLPGMVQ